MTNSKLLSPEEAWSGKIYSNGWKPPAWEQSP